MLPGVEVLSQETVYYAAFNWIVAGIGFVAAGIFVICLLITLFRKCEGTLQALGAIILCLFFGLIAGFATGGESDEIAYIKYEVIISDEVSFNEFTDNYEILEQRDRIYVIREKEKSE